MRILPLAYDFDKSFDVYWKTEEYIKSKHIGEKLLNHFWAYHNVGNVIPQTKANYWSGHYFPWTESWDELQISYNLVEIGFYKQSFYSLRSSFETGLLTVYWNLNDDGHLVIQEWLRSEVKTPRFNEVWEKLNSHKNFSKFQEFFDIKTKLLNLGYLHNYVHSKGLQHSYMMGKPKSNFQTFEADCFDEWLKSFEKIVKVLVILHLIKYPIGTIKFDYRKKFGIDVPSFGGLDISHVELIEKIIGSDIFAALEEVAKQDERVNEIMEWINSLDDMTDEELKNQVMESDKRWIKSQGFDRWLRMEEKLFKEFQDTEEYSKRIDELKKWAEANGYIKMKE